MTDPIPHARRSPMELARDAPEPAPDLVERVARVAADMCLSDAVDEWHRELARATISLMVEEAAKKLKRENDAIRALIPEAEP